MKRELCFYNLINEKNDRIWPDVLKNSFARIRYISQEIYRILVFYVLRGSTDFFHHFKEFLFIGNVDQTDSGKVNIKLYLLSSVDLLALINLNALNKSFDKRGGLLWIVLGFLVSV